VKEKAARLGIESLIEVPFPYFELPSGVLIENLGIKMCLDIGHTAIASLKKEKVPEKEVKTWLETFEEDIVAIYLHDVKFEDRRDHLLLGCGDLDLEKIFVSIRKSQCEYLLLECYEKDGVAVTYDDLEGALEFCKALG
jgi:sugar phosphate isomerase/epimerase